MTNTSKINKPKCIFFDVDGVLTDGSKLYSSEKGSPVIGKRLKSPTNHPPKKSLRFNFLFSIVL